MITVGRLAPGDQWDQNMLDRLFANELYPTGVTFKRVEGYPHADGAVLIIPGRYWHERIHDIDDAIASYEWVLAIRTGDEEDLFDIEQVAHPNIRWWVQSPRTDRDYGDARLFGVGFPPHFSDLPAPVPSKDVDVFLSAQNTHARRAACFAELDRLSTINQTVAVHQTSGFTEGMHPDCYAATMEGCRVAPAPSGAVSPDSFRLFEALEAHCVPIADDVSPVYDSRGYWRMLFPDAPFPILADYADLPGYVADQLRAWPSNANRITAWWMRQKRAMAQWLADDLSELGAV